MKDQIRLPLSAEEAAASKSAPASAPRRRGSPGRGSTAASKPAPESPAPWGSRTRPASVEQLVVAANRCLESEFPLLWVQGEISTLRQPSSGHIYFTLKDDRAAIPVAMWRSSVRRLKMRLEEGLAVNVRGRLGIYAAQGKFQLYAENVEPTGRGDRMAALERLKAKLRAEGLFDEERKRALPKWPRSVAVITSATGAAFSDIRKVIARRCPTSILLIPAVVQGQEAVPTLIEALQRAQAQKEVEVIIIGRGGGSVEDLWCFNDEALVRAIADCAIPVVSAVGHEIDITLADLAADCRAATPSQAGELVVPEYDRVAQRLGDLRQRLAMGLERRVIDRGHDLGRMQRALARQGRALVALQRDRLAQLQERMLRDITRLAPPRREALQKIERRLLALHPRRGIARDREALVALEHQLATKMREQMVQAQRRWSQAAAKLDMLSPLQVLGRGYSIVLDDKGQAIRSADELRVDQSLEIRFAKGRAQTQVRSIERPLPPKSS